jgi:hypothetical protein
MRILRIVLSWYFAILFLIFLRVTFDTYGDILRTFHRQGASRLLFNLLIQESVAAVLVIIFGMSSWTIWRKKASARGWAIIASLLDLMISIGVPLLYYHVQGARAFWQLECVFGLPTAIGAAGLVAFSRSRIQSDAQSTVEPLK